MSKEDWEIFNVYASEHCKESINTLKYETTLPDFLALSEFIDIIASINEESREEHEKEMKKAQRG